MLWEDFSQSRKGNGPVALRNSATQMWDFGCMKRRWGFFWATFKFAKKKTCYMLHGCLMTASLKLWIPCVGTQAISVGISQTCVSVAIASRSWFQVYVSSTYHIRAKLPWTLRPSGQRSQSIETLASNWSLSFLEGQGLSWDKLIRNRSRCSPAPQSRPGCIVSTYTPWTLAIACKHARHSFLCGVME